MPHRKIFRSNHVFPLFFRPAHCFFSYLCRVKFSKPAHHEKADTCNHFLLHDSGIRPSFLLHHLFTDKPAYDKKMV